MKNYFLNSKTLLSKQSPSHMCCKEISSRNLSHPLTQAVKLSQSLGLNGSAQNNIYSLISRTDKVELIATDFFSNPATIWVILSNILKVASPILWGSIYIFDLKMITFMLRVAIEDYCVFIGKLLLQLF